MSKKLASGADAIVLDIKVGHGAFMKTIEEAQKLARLMVAIGKGAGKKMTAILTGMDEPLGHKIGNGLEVYEAILTLKGHGPKDLVDVVCEIGAHLLGHANIEKDLVRARHMLNERLKSGLAYDTFVELIKYQKGDVSYVISPERLIAHQTIEVLSPESGYIDTINALDIGRAAMKLGAGRATKEDEILHDVGVDLHVKIGDAIQKGESLATLYVQHKGVDEAKELVLNAITIADQKRSIQLILDTINA
jgi:pyrimidine-nucleoside phosphorylase